MVNVEELLGRIGTSVRRARTEREMTLKELAAAADLSVRFVAQLEAGEANIAVGRLAAVADALGVRLAELIEGKERKSAVALLGLRGAGKSTIGPRVAAALGLPFVELDERIEEEAGLGLAEIFALDGAYYRRLESQCLAALLADQTPRVIALPGGIVHSEEAFDLALKHCSTIWLKAKPEDHMERVLKQGDRRPVANRPNAMAELRAILAARERLYARADVTIDTSRQSPNAAVSAVIVALERDGWTAPRVTPPRRTKE
jgi:XRE family transcriptional regulator, aerobic/anaerobic benzoate catabolism transcriptional regulator